MMGILVMAFCEYAFDHQPGETCEHCKLPVDKYGNTEADFRKCCFPDCGCDGARLCMAGEANSDALKCNVEGMYQRTDQKAVKAKTELIGLCIDDERRSRTHPA
jgi:hypothetical protein